ncbi:MAG TPA: peptidylprolyl isomerase [Acidimicrobiales bacterium]|nr:peptidylprolyl isomerase [Acidimicrobiales bacterium]
MGTVKRERQREGRQVRLAAAQAEQQRRQRIRTIRNFGIIVVVIIVALFVLSRLNSDDNKQTASTSSGGPTACPAADGSAPRTIDFSSAPPNCIDPAKSYTATFDTTAGIVDVKLDTTNTPSTANNFVVLSRYHYYDNTTLFRTAQSIGIVQGGSPHTNSANDPGPGYQLADEGYDYASLSQGPSGVTGGPYTYAAGDLVMARSASPNGGSAQFFFGVNDNVKNLDAQGTYVNFGSATQGLDVLQKILASGPEGEGSPSPPVTINKVTITES